MSHCSDYEASLKKEGGIPDGPVLESLLAGETLDKKVETKEEEPMSECQVRLLFTSPLFVVCVVLSLFLISVRSYMFAFLVCCLLVAPVTLTMLSLVKY